MRLDLYLAKSGKVKSRERATELITSGNVTVNGLVITKPAFEIVGDENIETVETLRYVSRGGLKLEYALKKFGIDVSGKTCLDIGASTGGFCDCLLQNGAAAVIAVDTGTDQLDPKIKNDPRVKSFENADIRDFKAADIGQTVGFLTCDVSFISITKILPKIAEILPEGTDGIILIKPQFEQEKRTSQKNGIIKDKKAREKALDRVLEAAKLLGLTVLNHTESYPPGKDGNIEYIAHIKSVGAAN
jgi:23S rRNA (cytidine1920-2'-O)/16S rRNA (cytidine1409-2'-O)-methyltransferase